MESYVTAALARIKPLISEYGTASEQCRQAHIEFRAARMEIQRLEDERCVIEAMLRVWADHPAVRFDDKDTLENALVTIKELRRGMQWKE